MLTPKLKRYAERIKKLIQEGMEISKLEKPSSVGPFIQDEDQIRVNSWYTSVRNILETSFGQKSPQFHQFIKETKDGTKHIDHAYDIHPIVGILEGALSDLENGFLMGQEFIIASDIFDSVLEQAKYLNQSDHKDPAAVLSRVVVEDALKRMARVEGISDILKASQINDELKKIGRYPQPQWRQIQAWLDIGNAAAHGKFDQYNQDDVQRMIEDIERFLVSEFKN